MPKRKVGPSPLASFSCSPSAAPGHDPTPPSGTSAGPVLRAWYEMTERADREADDQGLRTKLLADLAQLLHDPAFPAALQAEAMALMGRLARRMMAESPCQSGLVVMRGRFSTRHGRVG
ncbi:MAG: hypothetical protein MUF34_34820 [Polyangiaceae bacterium]|jgi:hypothetical protein|nr:hypothetical protein [Polyangiaceae bacterium]